jgi:hypothetical protein
MRSWSMANLTKVIVVVGISGLIIGLFHTDTWVDSGGELLAGIRYAGPPLHMVFTGAFFPPDAKEVKNERDVLKFLIEKEQRLFKYEEVKNLGSMVSETEILLAIRPFNVSITGPEKVMSTLRGPAGMGKRINLRGYLYPNNRRLVLESIEVVSDQGR